MDLAICVPEALLRHRAVRKVELVGSRAAGTAVTLSDWDFLVEADDFDAVVEALPALVEPLCPLARQWDPLGECPCYMLMLTGAIKIDLLFDRRHEPAPRWVVTAQTLPRIDAHFWDWVLRGAFRSPILTDRKRGVTDGSAEYVRPEHGAALGVEGPHRRVSGKPMGQYVNGPTIR